MSKDELTLLLNDYANSYLSESPIMADYRKEKIEEIISLFSHGVCADCRFESDHYCERIGSPVIKMNQTGPDTTDNNFGCTLLEPKETP